MVNSTTENTGVLLSDGTRLTQQNVPIATTTQVGVVKPDGISITVKSDGTVEATGGGSQQYVYSKAPISGSGTYLDPLTIKVASGLLVDSNGIYVDPDIKDLNNYYTKKQTDDTFIKSDNLPIATISDPGCVVVGNGLEIDKYGVLSVKTEPASLVDVLISTADIVHNKGVYSVSRTGLNTPLGIVTDDGIFVELQPSDYIKEEQEDGIILTTIFLNKAMVTVGHPVQGIWHIVTYRI